MRWRGAAAAARNIEEPGLRKLLQDGGRVFRRFVVFAKRIRQPGVRVQAGMNIGDIRQLFDIRPQVLGAKRAVQSDRKWPRMRNRIPERLGGLAGERAAAGIGDGAGYHDRHVDAMALEIIVDGEQARPCN